MRLSMIGVVLQMILVISAFCLGGTDKILSVVTIAMYFVIYINWIGIIRYTHKIIGFMIFLLTMVRYCILPFLIILSEDYFTLAYFRGIQNGFVYTDGSFLTLWELVFVGCYLKCQFPRWYGNAYKQEEIYLLSINGSNRTRVTFFSMIIVLLLGCMLIYPKSFSFFSSIFSINALSDEEILRSTSGSIGTLSIFAVRSFRLIFPIPFVMTLSRMYQYNPRPLYMVLGFVVFFIPYGTFFEGTSRNSIIIPIIALMFILPTIFNKHKKSIRTSLFVMLGAVSIVMIIWKSYTRFGMDTSADDFSLNGVIQYFEVYFAGVSNMGKALLAYDNAYIGFFDVFSILVTDICNYVPFLNSIVQSNMSSNDYFLEYIGRTDQVIPATGNGLFYLGYVLAPVVPIVNISITRLFEKKLYKRCIDVDELTIYTYATVMLAYNTFNNISSFYMKLTIYIIPSLLICIFAKKLSQQGKKSWT